MDREAYVATLYSFNTLAKLRGNGIPRVGGFWFELGGDVRITVNRASEVQVEPGDRVYTRAITYEGC